MHSSRRSRWRVASGRGQTFETSVSERASTRNEETGVGDAVAGGSRQERVVGKKEWGGRGMTTTDREMECGTETVPCGRHVSFFLIIIFNPIHCMVQQFALTPTFEILQGSLSDESPQRRWIRPAR